MLYFLFFCLVGQLGHICDKLKKTLLGLVCINNYNIYAQKGSGRYRSGSWHFTEDCKGNEYEKFLINKGQTDYYPLQEIGICQRVKRHLFWLKLVCQG